MSFAGVYPHHHQGRKEGPYQRRGDAVICWLTGYDQKGLQEQIDQKTSLEQFFDKHHRSIPMPHSLPVLLSAATGWKIIRPAHAKDPYMDKLVDELEEKMEKILAS